jgi:transcriptional regulator with XRE-family HTH domain
MNPSFSKWLDTEIAQRGWSQSEAARRGAISSQMVNAVINGQANPGIEFCRGIAKALGIPLEEVFRFAGILPTKPVRTADHRPVYHVGNNLDERLAKAFGRLGVADQERLVDLAERLAGVVAGRIIGDEGE